MKWLSLIWGISLFFLIVLSLFFVRVYDLNEYKESLKIYNRDREDLILSNEVLKYLSYASSEEDIAFLGIKEVSHMNDVKFLFSIARIILFISLILTLLIFFWFSHSNSLEGLFKPALIAGTLLIIFPLVLRSFDFSNLFQNFHQLLFPRGNYAFPDSSLLIQLFPSEFFESFAFWLGFRVFISGFFVCLLGVVFRFNEEIRLFFSSFLRRI